MSEAAEWYDNGGIAHLLRTSRVEGHVPAKCGRMLLRDPALIHSLDEAEPPERAKCGNCPWGEVDA